MINALDASNIADDLAVFADLGTTAPTLEATNEGYVIRLVRSGEITELIVRGETDAIIEAIGERQVKHVNFKALLASDNYGSLREWASKQTAYLAHELALSGDLLPIKGRLNNGVTTLTQKDVDEFLAAPQKSGSTRVLLIDGPAGIGKTQFIVGLTSARAEGYVKIRRPLILHVQSRGRTLSYLYDLIAYSLQRLRLSVTFDQIPILAKYGLVTLAIDGFDELADPDGYNLAWSQVSDLIGNLRGTGSIVLAGRETFIGRDRIVRDIPALRPDEDDISVLTLEPPNKTQALDWLTRQGWNPTQLDNIESFLEPSSLALRPFFLKTLSDQQIADRFSDTTAISVLSILMDAMVERETNKFGDAVEKELSPVQRRKYVNDLMCEVSRDMADNSSIAVSDATLAWLVDVCVPGDVSEPTRRILRARSQVLAFLTNDDRPGYRRFFHEKFYEYFLSLVLIDTLSKEQISKPVTRGILGASFLDTFSAVLTGDAKSTLATAFLTGAAKLLQAYPSVDRARGNISALLVACLSVSDAINGFSLEDAEIDEARFSGTASAAALKNITISQFDCRGGDISAVQFSNCFVFTLIADSKTILPKTFPLPTRVQDLSSGGATILDPAEVQSWVSAHLLDPPQRQAGLVPDDLRDHPVMRLVSKVCRLRQYWLRRGDDIQAKRVLDNEYWPLLEKALQDNGLLKVEYRQASGTDARFMHVRQGDDILAENEANPNVKNFYRDLVGAIQPRPF